MNNPSLSNRCIFGTARLHDLGGCRADQKVQTGLYRKKDDWQEQNFRMPEYFRAEVTSNGLQFLS